MKVTGFASLFINKRDNGKKGVAKKEWNELSVSLGRKLEDGNYDNASMRCYIDEDLLDDLVESYGTDSLIKVDIKEGYINFKRYQRQDGSNGVQFYLTLVDFEEVDSFTEEAPKASTAKASTAKASTAKASTAKASTAKPSTAKASTAKLTNTKAKKNK